MPFPVLGSNSAVAEYEIDNSLRFNDDDSAYLSRTPSSASNRKTWTWSGWVKRGNISLNMVLFSADNTVGHGIYLDTADKLYLTKSAVGNYGIDAKLRDVSAWYHIVVAVDTTQTGMSNIVKFYINGVQHTASGTTLYSTNEDTNINNNSVHNIGRFSKNSSFYYDGYLSEVTFVDGQQLAPTEFGETNDNGVWIPKRFSGSYGTNGFKLEFKNSGSLGTDTSGNTNDWTSNNLTATDQTTDTPTNNFATGNPLDVRQGATFSEGNCKIVTNSSNRNYVISTIGVTSGKWYCEAKITDGNTNAWLGVADLDDLLTNSASSLGDNSNEIGLNYEGTYQKNNVNTAGWGGTHTNNDIIGILLDMDNNRITYHKNASYADGAGNFDESSPTAYISFTNSTMTFAFGDGAGAGTSTYELNFGNAPFTISSGNSDANGYGNFEYAVPSGYYALCTKNLAEYG